MIRWLFNEGPLGEFQGIAALEIDGQTYTPDELEQIIRQWQAATTPKVCGFSVQEASRSICEVPGCDTKQDGLSRYCKKHDMRFRRHGDPTVTKQPWSKKREKRS